MTKSKICYLVSGILFFIISILIIGLLPLRIRHPNVALFGDSIYNYSLSFILTNISFYMFMKVKEIHKVIIRYLLLFLMVYFVLVFSSNCVFDFTLRKIIGWYEKNSLTNTTEYAQLWVIWSNDLSRNAMYFWGILYSILAVTIYFGTMLLKSKFGK